MNETTIQSNILKKLRALPRSIWVKPTITNFAGFPDIVGLYDGKFIAIEVKTETGVITKLQQHWIKKINEYGGISFVATSYSDVIENLLS